MTAKNGKPGFWDNLIAPKGGLFGPQLAGWTPGPAAKSGLGCRILADQMVEVAPSIALAADVYVPKAPRRYPAVIAFAAYSKELQAAGVPAGNNETGSPPVFTDRGYAHVIVTRVGWAVPAETMPSTSTTQTWRTTPKSFSGRRPSPGATGRWCCSAPPITG
ncbi:hypothetical protein GGQ86_000559 [Xanthobacter flavus]|nr:hypothetical protein [Xanthobacter flavus]MDR6332112.1 hypothetical protein [Xanthobacter flavus]